MPPSVARGHSVADPNAARPLFRKGSEHLVYPPLETALVVLKGKVEHVALLAACLPETVASGSDGKPEHRA